MTARKGAKASYTDLYVLYGFGFVRPGLLYVNLLIDFARTSFFLRASVRGTKHEDGLAQKYKARDF